MTKLFAILPAVILLAACNGDRSPEAQASADAMAEGEVLGGTISDEMLPLDRLKSQSPPLKTEPKEGSSSADSSEPAAEEQDEPASAAGATDEEEVPAEEG
jgi:hypothetical protein